MVLLRLFCNPQIKQKCIYSDFGLLNDYRDLARDFIPANYIHVRFAQRKNTHVRVGLLYKLTNFLLLCDTKSIFAQQ